MKKICGWWWSLGRSPFCRQASYQRRSLTAAPTDRTGHWTSSRGAPTPLQSNSIRRRLILRSTRIAKGVYHFTTITVPANVSVKLRADKVGWTPIYRLARDVD